jgi:hypothetical protein
MNSEEQKQETAINGEEPEAPRRARVPRPRLPKARLAKVSVPKPHLPKPRVPRPDLPEPVARGLFAVQERVIWPVEDRLQPVGLGPNRKLLVGGGLGTIAVVAVAAVVAFSGGGGSSQPPTTQVAITSAAPPARTTYVEPLPTPEKPKGPTLHGAEPVFTPPAEERKRTSAEGAPKAPADTEKLSSSQKVDEAPAPSDAQDAAAAATAGTTTLSSPATDTISSDPANSKAAPTATSARAATAPVTVPAGPPAGPAALKVARQFAQGFVVYETGGEEVEFKDAFDESATPELTKALMQRPPKQPATVKVPRAKVVNVVPGPSHGTVYKVSVSLLRVGVTSELRLSMEKLKGGQGWRVTDVLG